MMRYTLGMIAAIPEFGPNWLFRLCERPIALLQWMAGKERGDGRDFNDGYDRVANVACDIAKRGK
jgi:hypothetical protein